MRTVGAEHGTVTRESGGSRPSTGPLLCVSIVDFLVVVFFFVRVRRSKGDEGGGEPAQLYLTMCLLEIWIEGRTGFDLLRETAYIIYFNQK